MEWYISTVKDMCKMNISENDVLLSKVYQDERQAELFCRARLVELWDQRKSKDFALRAVQKAVHSIDDWAHSFTIRAPTTAIPLNERRGAPSPYRPSEITPPVLSSRKSSFTQLVFPLASSSYGRLSAASSRKFNREGSPHSSSGALYPRQSTREMSNFGIISPHCPSRHGSLLPDKQLKSQYTASRRGSLADGQPASSEIPDLVPEPQPDKLAQLTTFLTLAWTSFYTFGVEVSNSFPTQLLVRTFQHILFARWLWSTVVSVVILSFLWNLAVEALRNVPVVGPITVWLMRKFGVFVFSPAWSLIDSTLRPLSGIRSGISFPGYFRDIVMIPSLFGNKYVTDPTSLSLPGDIPLPTANFSFGIHATINDTARLSQLGISLLPVTLMIRHSSSSIAFACNIVKASNVYYKVDLVENYHTLENSTNVLYHTLGRFDIKLDVAIESLASDMRICRSKVLRQIDGASSSATGPHLVPSLAFELSSLLSTNCLGNYLSRPLSKREIQGCASFSAILLQSYCLISSQALTICEPIRTLSSYYSRHFSPSDMETRKSVLRPIMDFLDLVDTINVGSWISQEAGFCFQGLLKNITHRSMSFVSRMKIERLKN